MPLVLRTTNGAPLTWEQGDENLLYLYSGSMYTPYSGSVTISGSLEVSGSITVSDLIGTASYAVSAMTASYFSGSISNAISSSHSVNADTASFANYAVNTDSASVAISSSYTVNAATASYVNNLSQAINVSGSLTITGSFALASRSRPSASTEIPGQIYFDNFNSNFYGWNGSAWVQLNN